MFGRWCEPNGLPAEEQYPQRVTFWTGDVDVTACMPCVAQYQRFVCHEPTSRLLRSQIIEL
jgi:hypothetical protein